MTDVQLLMEKKIMKRNIIILKNDYHGGLGSSDLTWNNKKLSLANFVRILCMSFGLCHISLVVEHHLAASDELPRLPLNLWDMAVQYADKFMAIAKHI